MEEDTGATAAVGLVAEQDAAELDAVVAAATAEEGARTVAEVGLSAAAEEMMLAAEQGLLFAADGCLVKFSTPPYVYCRSSLEFQLVSYIKI